MLLVALLNEKKIADRMEMRKAVSDNFGDRTLFEGGLTTESRGGHQEKIVCKGCDSFVVRINHSSGAWTISKKSKVDHGDISDTGLFVPCGARAHLKKIPTIDLFDDEKIGTFTTKKIPQERRKSATSSASIASLPTIQGLKAANPSKSLTISQVLLLTFVRNLVLV